MKTCSRCERKIYKPGFRYCAFCQAAIKKEMKDSGYLTEPLPNKRRRGKDLRESTNDTKYGKDA
jgi:hypothetical protein